MNQRRFLLIASQCKNLNQPLGFLPDVAKRFHALMINPGPGESVGVTVENGKPGLLLDPKVAHAKEAIEAAIQESAEARDSLILAFIGHGECPNEMGGDFYLMLDDSANATSDGAILISQFVKERLDSRLAGLVLLLDACHAGEGAWQAMERWAQSAKGDISFEILTAADDRSTANAALARALTELLERGDPELDARFRCDRVHRRLKERNPKFQYAGYNPGCDLGRNIARDPGDVFWNNADSPGRDLLLKQTEYFQPTRQLSKLVKTSQEHRVVLLTGEAGAGKSALASGLARPELTAGLVPDGFVQAITILDARHTLHDWARDLTVQLGRSVMEFAEGVDEFHRSIPLEQRNRLDFLNQLVLGPLTYLPDRPVVRLVFDGFDRLAAEARHNLRNALEGRPEHVFVVLTSREVLPECPAGEVLRCDRTDQAGVKRYLESRRVTESAIPAILERAENNWLIARLLSNAVVADPDIDLSLLPRTIKAAYETNLSQATGGSADVWRTRLAPVLGSLAVAGPGVSVPLPLLAHACTSLGGPNDPQEFESVLIALRGLVVRREGVPADPVGLFHSTLNECLLDLEDGLAGFSIDARAAHQAMVDAIIALAPSSQHKPDDPLHRYAFLREADHRWALDDVDGARGCLARRESNDPRENLERWRGWLSRFQDRLGKLDQSILVPRSWVAKWTGEAGDAQEALRLSSELRKDMERVLGPDHRATLTTRNNIAGWTSAVGNAGEALRLSSDLLPDQERVLGRDDPETLKTRGNIASWTGGMGNAREALRLFSDLLPDQERVLGRDHRDTLTTRNNIASWTGAAGDAREALRQLSELLKDQERVVGRGHPDLLGIRNNIASWTGSVGKAREALRMLSELLPDTERVLGRDHPNTLTIRHNIAHMTGKSGDARRALTLFYGLLPDRERVLGRDHPDTLTTRNNIASWTGMAGDPRRALWLCSDLLLDRERVLGPDHPDTLRTRVNIASMTSEAGDVREALRLISDLLPALERVLGRDHPDTLITRNSIASLTGEAGDAREALRLLSDLLPDQERLLGRDHPDSFRTRNNISALTGEAGDAREAVRLLSDLLPEMERVLGRDHPDTLTTRNNIASWTGKAGDSRKALGLFSELLSDTERVLGRDHPNSLRIHGNIAHFTGEAGEAREALRMFSELLPHRVRVLGRDHPDTLATRNNIAMCTGEAGNAEEALLLLSKLLQDAVRVLGHDHPDTLRTRGNFAHWTGRSGDAKDALRLSSELLPDRERLQGPDHPDTLMTRKNIARWTGEAGDACGALQLFSELLTDRERVLGRDHPDTLKTLDSLATWAIRTGDRESGCKHLHDGLMRTEARFGHDHPLREQFQSAIRNFGCEEPEPPFTPEP